MALPSWLSAVVFIWRCVIYASLVPEDAIQTKIKEMETTTTISIQPDVDDKPKRTRKTHRKVRTGCLTCKIRRKKCDETKPSCQRCSSTGRRCDGYEINEPQIKTIKAASPPDSAVDVSSQRGTKSSSSSSPHLAESRHQFLQIWRPPKSAWFETDHDYYCFDFFRKRTGPEFTAYFDSSIWRTFMVRACFLHPTVLQAAAAVGAVHRRFELGISPEAFRFCDIALKQYRKALGCLNDDLRSGHPLGAEFNMIVSILLSIFETFQGNYDAALDRYSTGLKGLLSRRRRTTQSESSYKTVNVGYESLHNFTDRLEQRSPTFFGNKTNILSHPGVDSQLSPIPKKFLSLEEARDVIFTEGLWIWDSWLQLELGNLDGFSTQHTHVSRLLEWSIAYAEYNKTPLPQGTSQDWRSTHLLRIYREVLYLVILTQLAFHKPDGAVIVPLCYPPESCNCHTSCRNYAERKSALDAHFARIMVLSEDIFTATSFGYGGHSLNVDGGIGPPIYLGASNCRSTKVRHQVTSLLAQDDLKKKVFDTLGVYAIAEKLASVEEHAVMRAGALPGVLDPKWVDYTCYLEESKILLRYCREDEYGGLIWTQEWITY